MAEAETLDALFQARGLGVEVTRGAGTATLRPRGPRPRRDQRSGPRGRRGVGVVHDEDGVLERDCDCVVSKAGNPAIYLARLAAAGRTGEARALGVDGLAGVGALVVHLRVGALQHAERPVADRGRARLGPNSIEKCLALVLACKII